MISQQAYSMRRLLSDIDVRNVEARIVVIDASRECAALAKTASGDGLANMDPESHTLLSFSAQPGQVFKDLPGASLGLFTASLIEALKTPELNLVGIFNKLQNLVAKSGGAPTPYFISSLIGNFALIAPPLAPPPKPIIPPVSEELTPGTSRENLRDRLMYVWIPPGTFKMGCAPPDRNCAADEKPQHQVKISKGFWMTRTEVTVGAYERFTDATGHRPPSRTKTNPKWILTDHPVTMVSWQDARDYCQWAGGRLPTEAEWEYAARGGRSDEIYPWGNRFDAELVNSFEHSKKKGKFLETVPVRRYETNGFNLYDMAGNVREWTNDVYDPTEYNRGGAVVDPHEDGEGKRRIIRGGSFNGGSKDLRLSLRDHREVLREVTNQTGFRCILARL
jgi:formylglycine-generating enzyme required for sulfatase activity